MYVNQLIILSNREQCVGVPGLFEPVIRVVAVENVAIVAVIAGERLGSTETAFLPCGEYAIEILEEQMLCRDLMLVDRYVEWKCDHLRNGDLLTRDHRT